MKLTVSRIFALLPALAYCSIYLEVADLYRSDVRSYYKSDEKLIETHRLFEKAVKSPEGTLQTLTHPYVLTLKPDCNEACHSLLFNEFGKKRYSVLDSTHAQVSAKAQEIQNFKNKNPDVLEHYTPLHPEIKVDKSVRNLVPTAEGCGAVFIPKLTKENENIKVKIGGYKASLLILAVVTSEEEKQGFLNFASTASEEADFNFILEGNPKNLNSDQRMYARVHISQCEQVMNIANLFAQRSEVIWVERQFPAFPLNYWARGSCETGDYTNTYLGSKLKLTGEGQIIGVVDTGIDMESCYFRDDDEDTVYVSASAASSTTPNYNHRKVIQYINYADGLDDADAHGTHVSGSVAGKSVSTGDGSSDQDGMAADAKISFFDVGVKDQDSLEIPSNLNDDLFAILYESGARILTNSWGTTSNSYNVLSFTADEFMRDYPEALVLTSAGNSGDDGANTVGSPANYKNGLSVGAGLNAYDSWVSNGNTDVTNRPQYDIDSVAYFSSQGPTADGRLSPDILAPGWWVNSAQGFYNSAFPFCDTFDNAGTSMACPIAAGFATLARQYFLEGYYPLGEKNESAGFVPSGALLKAVLVHSGRPVIYRVRSRNSITELTEYPSNVQGYGRMQLNTVLRNGSSDSLALFVVGAAYSSDPRYAEISTLVDVDSYNFTTKSTTDVRVTLAYTDLPALNSQVIMINKLQVKLTDLSDGTEYLPYNTDGTLQVIDAANITENSKLTVTVYATALSAVQPYSIVMTGSGLQNRNFTVDEVLEGDDGDDGGTGGNGDSSTSEDSSNGLTLIQIVGVAIGVGLIVLIVVMLIMFFCTSMFRTAPRSYGSTNAVPPSAPPAAAH